MLSQTGLYALQALLHLAVQGNGAQVPAAVMARPPVITFRRIPVRSLLFRL